MSGEAGWAIVDDVEIASDRNADRSKRNFRGVGERHRLGRTLRLQNFVAEG